MLAEIKKLFYLLDKRSKKLLPLFILATVIISFVEIIGIGLIYPFLRILIDPEAIGNSWYLSELFYLVTDETECFTECPETAYPADINQFLVRLGIAIVAAILTKNIVIILLKKWQINFVYKSDYSLGVRLFSYYMNLAYLDITKRNSNQLLVNMYDTVPKVCGSYFFSIMNLLSEILMATLLCGVLLIADFWISLSTFVFIFSAAGIFYLLTRKKFQIFGENQQKLSFHVFKSIKEAFIGYKELAVLQRIDYYKKLYPAHKLKHAMNSSSNDWYRSIPVPYLESVLVLGVALLFVISLLTKDVGVAVAITGLFAVAGLRLTQGANKIVANLTTLKYATFGLNVVYDDLINETGKKLLDSESSLSSGSKGPIIFESLNLHNIHFNFPERKDFYIEQINLRINKGEIIGLVGESGAGKTTLIDIILGLIKPDRGEITINNTLNLKNNLYEWRNIIGYVPQSIYISDDKIINNIAIGIPTEQIDTEKIKESLEKAKLSDFINSLPMGLNTTVGENGIQLSGGQRQRIGIARALYKNAKILIFDEATSSLDNKTENEISRMIDNLGNQHTIIIIAHRLSTITKCSKIIFMKKGKIVDTGKFQDLKEANKDFKELVDLSTLTSQVL